MKCYKMHDTNKSQTMNPPFYKDAVVIYRGFSVCQDHLEELQEEGALLHNIPDWKIVQGNPLRPLEEVPETAEEALSRENITVVSEKLLRAEPPDA